MNRTFAPILLLALGACANSGLEEAAGLGVDEGEVIDGEFIINTEVPADVAEELGLIQLDWDDTLGAGLFRTDQVLSRVAIEATLKERVRGGLSVESNRPTRASAVDPYRWIQWNMDMMKVETAWGYSTGAGTTVAVIDTGVSWSGSDRPVNMVAGWDYVDNDSDPTDENGHGTHVAGTIAQASDNGIGVVGMAPDTTILVYRVLDQNGNGSVYWSAKAITAAADAGADVINLSLGSAYGSNTEAQAVSYASSLGVVIVAATGNAGANTVDYPAAYSEAIAVGAVGGDKGVASYSNGGSHIDVVAPGGESGSDFNGDGYGDGILQETITGYEFFDGTSMATPHVAGLSALLISAGADPADVPNLIRNTAEDVGSNGWDMWTGYGLIDPVAALSEVGPAAPGGGEDPGPESDTTAPIISNIGGTRSGDSLTLTWTTDEPATSEIEFEDYGLFGDDTALVTAHEQGFTIDGGASYTFRMIAVDAAGNESTSGWWVTNP